MSFEQMDLLSYQLTPQELTPPPPVAPVATAQVKVGDRRFLLPLVDAKGRTRGTFHGLCGTICGFNAVGFALLDFGVGHPYPAPVERLTEVSDAS